MQGTRLNDLLAVGAEIIGGELQRQWYIHCLRLIALLGGFFSASVIITWAGQRAVWDIIASLFLLAFVELISWLTYKQTWLQGKASLNLYKIGLLFGLAVEAFKLSS
ncbi:MAG: DUF565 domain-containing protein [Pseudanabaenaceae cyanobacterium SKYGB_i_bin29]|nr:DUF565 domain-containing protein [Pseudanabaenaceae cyanobacterium SKYG29]MDW8422548.1 DUF565 domain-containing protein [Pseudanabaenaceae cyanobacterium SKYGB_i_bin29]